MKIQWKIPSVRLGKKKETKTSVLLFIEVAKENSDWTECLLTSHHEISQARFQISLMPTSGDRESRNYCNGCLEYDVVWCLRRCWNYWCCLTYNRVPSVKQIRLSISHTNPGWVVVVVISAFSPPLASHIDPSVSGWDPLSFSESSIYIQNHVSNEQCYQLHNKAKFKSLCLM